ncbi:MAG: hypothetical protein JHD35_13930 [Sphingopyxis sp.]|nr:hypothetical protein [Sphingopyxis sp.]
MRTPPSGVLDQSIEGIVRTPGLGPLRGVALSVRRHQFNAALGGLRLGSEWDVAASAQLGAYRISVERADYSAANFGRNTRRFWFTLARNF